MMVGTTPQATERQIIERSWFNKYIDIPFEDCQFKIIADFDKYLAHEYGNYMSPPPKKSSPHTFSNAYWI